LRRDKKTATCLSRLPLISIVIHSPGRRITVPQRTEIFMSPHFSPLSSLRRAEKRNPRSQ
jgi:hypothetical protein